MRVGGETLVLNLCTEYLFHFISFFFFCSFIKKGFRKKGKGFLEFGVSLFVLCPAVEREAGDSELCPMVTQTKKKKIKKIAY